MKHQEDPNSIDEKINRGCMTALIILAWLVLFAFVAMFGFCVDNLV